MLLTSDVMSFVNCTVHIRIRVNQYVLYKNINIS